jgi:hypothetical protein
MESVTGLGTTVVKPAAHAEAPPAATDPAIFAAEASSFVAAAFRCAIFSWLSRGPWQGTRNPLCFN